MSHRFSTNWLLIPLIVACAEGALGGKPPADRPGGASGANAAIASGSDAPMARADAGSGSAPPSAMQHVSTDDHDHDGFTVAGGDCEDYSSQINPAAYDFPGNGFDEDCADGDADVADVDCDARLLLDSVDASDGARAIGLCRFVGAGDRGWGVISARYLQPDGKSPAPNALQVGILPQLGSIAPPRGASMLALSSGVARGPGQVGYTRDCDAYTTDRPGTAPPGYPKQGSSCPDLPSEDVHDGAAIELLVRVPSNARSLSFVSAFFTYEYPDFICSYYNDFFVALLEPKPPNLPDGNIVFDQDGNAVSVNNALLQVCAKGSHGGRDFSCPQGNALLQGTGFGDEASCGKLPEGTIIGPDTGPNGREPGAASTGWLQTMAPVEPGSIITLRFAIWDSGDAYLDSLVLVDHFLWGIDTTVIETRPVVLQ